MLPGFRFLFAAIMLSMSLLIFGLGAAALFRAAHESVASNSSWRATPDVPFAQRPETTLPMLATLRVEPVMEKPAATAKIAAAPAAPSAVTAEPKASDQLAALHPVEALKETAKAEPAQVETTKTEIAKPADAPAKPADTPIPAPAAEIPTAPEAAAVTTTTETTTPASETRTAAVASSDTASIKNEPVVVQPEPAAPAPAGPAAVTATATEAPPPATPSMSPETSDAITKIATLGGPPVDITDTPAIELRAVKIPRARPDESAIKKRAHARRALRRRRLAARARLLAQQQLQANPFAQQPFPQTQNFATTATSAPR